MYVPKLRAQHSYMRQIDGTRTDLNSVKTLPRAPLGPSTSERSTSEGQIREHNIPRP